jgi:ubiquinone/menaquinone biosynthesis C-methylase UbiE
MKRDWNARARENAMHYVASGRDDWTLAEFLESGRESVEAEVVRDLELIAPGRDPKELRVLEIGCGLGRMTKHLADIFGEVHGIDVSGEMIARAREVLAGTSNVFVYETSGEDLRLFPDRFFDFVFSFIVLQHVPLKEVVVAYLREAYRTLRPGSVFKFQVMGVVVEGERDTWVGVGFTEDELRVLAGEIGFDVVRSEGAGTQYFWNWWRRPAEIA